MDLGAPHTRIPHEISEQLMCSHFSEHQRRLLDLIFRLSWGCGKEWAYVPKQRDFTVVGVGENKVKLHIDWLVEAKVIDRDGCFYSFNLIYDDWRVSRALNYSPARFRELLHINLADKQHAESGSKLAESGSLYAESGSRDNYENLPKREVETCRKGKNQLAEKGSSLATNSATLKEPIKELLKNIGDNILDLLEKKIKTQDGEEKDAGEIWQYILKTLNGKISAGNYNCWLAETDGLGIYENIFFISVKSSIHADAITNRMSPPIEKELTAYIGRPIKVAPALVLNYSK